MTQDHDILLPTWALRSAVEKISPDARDQIANILADGINQIAPRMNSGLDLQGPEVALRENGIFSLGQLFSSEQCASIVERVKQLPCFGAHVPAFSDRVAGTFESIKTRSPYGSYLLHHALEIPELMSVATNQAILQIADIYLGCQPTVYSIHLFWTFGGLPKPAHTHLWHRDIDDYRFLSCFVYLTDVEKGEGEFQFLGKTHNINKLTARLEPMNRDRIQQGKPPIDARSFFPSESPAPVCDPAELESVISDEIQSFVGPAGSAFIGDTYGLHRGTVPCNRDRLVCWIRFGLTKNLSYIRDQTQPRRASELSYLSTTSEIPWAYRLILT